MFDWFFRRNKRAYLKGMNQMHYYEDGKRLTIHTEMEAVPKYSLRLFLSDSAHWDAPFNGLLLTTTDRERIKKNIEKQWIKYFLYWD